MRLFREDVYRLIAVAKGNVPASLADQRLAANLYRELVHGLTEQLQHQALGDLSITHETVRERLELAYRQYRRRPKGGLL